MNTASATFRPARGRRRSVTVVLGLMLPLSAFAELSDESLLGPGLRSRPAYDGSASQHAEWVPVVRYLGQPWFVRSTQGVLEGGVRMALAPGPHAGAQLAYEPGRKTSESDFLQRHDLSDADPGASVGVQVEWDHTFGPMPITLLARAPAHRRPARRPGRPAPQCRGFPRWTGRRGAVYPGDMGECEVGRLSVRHCPSAVGRHRLAGVPCRKRMVVCELRLSLVGRPEPGLDRGRQHGDAASARRRGAQPARGTRVERLCKRRSRLSFLTSAQPLSSSGRAYAMPLMTKVRPSRSLEAARHSQRPQAEVKCLQDRRS